MVFSRTRPAEERGPEATWQEDAPWPWLGGDSAAGELDGEGLEEEPGEDELESFGPAPAPPNLKARRRGTLAKPEERQHPPISPQQKLLLLDTWLRSGLPARDFGALVNVSRHTLFAWKRRFEQQGPAGLMEQPKNVAGGSRLPELTKRTILMLKTSHPDWGCQRISDMLLRGPRKAKILGRANDV